jgi:hypothetical protein
MQKLSGKCLVMLYTSCRVSSQGIKQNWVCIFLSFLQVSTNFTRIIIKASLFKKLIMQRSLESFQSSQKYPRDKSLTSMPSDSGGGSQVAEGCDWTHMGSIVEDSRTGTAPARVFGDARLRRPLELRFRWGWGGAAQCVGARASVGPSGGLRVAGRHWVRA